MVKIRSRGEQARAFILSHVEAHPRDIARKTAEKFGITRQAVSKHLTQLVREGALSATGTTRKIYRLCSVAEWSKRYPLKPGLAEDVVWRLDVAPSLGHLPTNVLDIWHYGFTEMFNNAIDHSGGKRISVHLTKTATSAEIFIVDDGVGIFRKIQDALGLLDERHAVLELSKGKLTTDPARHTGEGIFFTSRMFDRFGILSGVTGFSHDFGDDADWIQEMTPAKGTAVVMSLNNHTSRTLRRVFSQFTSGEELGFTKTIVPVRLAQYGDDLLVSRSQAKRLLARVDRFRTVILDFEGVKSIGQAFADEIFRVFSLAHPDIDLHGIHANTDVQDMILRAQAARAETVKASSQRA